MAHWSTWFLVLACPINALGMLGINRISSIGASCVYVANNLTLYPFNCPSPDLDYGCRCRDPAFLGTVLICVDDNSQTPDTITQSYSYLIEFCKLQAHQRYLFEDLALIFQNATKTAISPSNITSPLLSPVLPDRELYEISNDSVESLLRNRLVSTILGGGLIGYWALVVLVGLMTNMGVWCVPGIRNVLNGAILRWVQRHLINPQLLSRNTNKRRITWIGRTTSKIVSTFPTRLESLVIFGYFLALVVFCCIDYKLLFPNTIFKYRSCGTLVYIADRTGIITITQFPVLFLFAGRNNFLILVTGWSYRTFNIYHRWIARLVWILIVIHSVCYVGFSTQNRDYTERWSLNKWRWANTAVICGGVIIILSIRGIRKAVYEVFKHLHQLLAIIFLAGCWQHCKTLGWMQFVYATVAIWAFDHLIRLGKIFISGGIVKAQCEALVEYLDEKGISEKADFIRVSVTHSGWWRNYPGCYVFIYFLQPAYFWQSHPFTIIESSSEDTIDQLTMTIRVKDGMTRQLADYLIKEPGRVAEINCLIEGPYGTPLAFRNYQNAVFIAAGVGFTVVYTLAKDLARQFSAQMLRNPSSEHCVTVVWMTPTVKSLETFLPEIISLADNNIIHLRIYVTQDDLERSHKDCLHPLRADTIFKIITNSRPGVHVTLGKRPAIKRQLLQHLNRHSFGNTAVVACGPDPMNRDVRAATGKWLKSNKKYTNRVDYFEEELLW